MNSYHLNLVFESTVNSSGYKVSKSRCVLQFYKFGLRNRKMIPNIPANLKQNRIVIIIMVMIKDRMYCNGPVKVRLRWNAVRGLKREINAKLQWSEARLQEWDNIVPKECTRLITLSRKTLLLVITAKVCSTSSWIIEWCFCILV